jgi:Cu-processing system ATP-binding protein
MPQIVRFPENLTGRELLEMITDLRGGEAAPDIELIGAFALEKDLDKPFRTLSGGTRQKVNAAIAFRFHAELLILDEPTAGLDPVATRALKEKVRKERDNGRAVVITSHNLGELDALADDVAFLLDGRVRYRGTLDALKEETGETDLEGAIAQLMIRENGT